MIKKFYNNFLFKNFLHLVIIFALIYINFYCLKKNNTIFIAEKFVSVDKANLRTDPLNISSIIEILERNTPVKIIDSTDEKIKIGNLNDYWYKVELKNGVRGWLYGPTLANTTTKEKEIVLNKDKKNKIQTKKVSEQDELYQEQILLNRQLLTGSISGAKNLSVSTLSSAKNNTTLKIKTLTK